MFVDGSPVISKSFVNQISSTYVQRFSRAATSRRSPPRFRSFGALLLLLCEYKRTLPSALRVLLDFADGAERNILFALFRSTPSVLPRASRQTTHSRPFPRQTQRPTRSEIHQMALQSMCEGSDTGIRPWNGSAGSGYVIQLCFCNTLSSDVPDRAVLQFDSRWDYDRSQS